MSNNKRQIVRIIEVFAGIFLILATLSVLVSYLLNFEFTSPDRSIDEDLNYLFESATQQKTSAISWLITSALFLVLLPLYIIVYYRFNRLVQVLNALLITAMAVLFLRTAMAGFSIADFVKSLPEGEILQPGTQLLSYIRDSMLLFQVGLTAYGGLALILGVNGIWKVRLSIFANILLCLSGPVLIIYTWIDPENILLTTSIAVSSIGFLIVGAKLVVKGIKRKRGLIPDDEDYAE